MLHVMSTVLVKVEQYGQKRNTCARFFFHPATLLKQVGHTVENM
jgi:hypothetical protein